MGAGAGKEEVGHGAESTVHARQRYAQQAPERISQVRPGRKPAVLPQLRTAWTHPRSFLNA